MKLTALGKARVQDRVDHLEKQYELAYAHWSGSVLFGRRTNVRARRDMERFDKRIKRLKKLLREEE